MIELGSGGVRSKSFGREGTPHASPKVLSANAPPDNP